MIKTLMVSAAALTIGTAAFNSAPAEAHGLQQYPLYVTVHSKCYTEQVKVLVGYKWVYANYAWIQVPVFDWKTVTRCY